MNPEKHKISAQITIQKSLAGDGRRFTVFNCAVDGINSGDQIVAENFINSLKKDGFYYLLQGECGEAGCCGSVMKVRNTKDVIIWEKSYRSVGLGLGDDEPEMDTELKELTLYGDKKIQFPIAFDRIEYEMLAVKLAEIEQTTKKDTK